jgi:hypothetical protein
VSVLLQVLLKLLGLPVANLNGTDGGVVGFLELDRPVADVLA